MVQKINYTVEKEKLDFISIKTLDRISVDKKNFDRLSKETLFRKMNSENPVFITKPIVKKGIIHYIDTEKNMDRCLIFLCEGNRVTIEQHVQYGNSLYKLSTVVFCTKDEVAMDFAFMNLVSEISCPVHLTEIDKKMYYQLFEFPVNAYIYIVDYLNSVRNLCETKIKDRFVMEKESSVFMHRITINNVMTCYTQHGEIAKLIYK